jgi:enoyl-CoA hydratase/carnithine racemase
MAKAVELTRENGIAVITFSRPETLNTMTYDMLEQLGAAYRRCDEDDDVRVVVVTGSGKAFCAGADLSDGTAFDSTERDDISSCPLDFQAWQVRKPVIAACNGHAVGVGLGIAAQCDLRVLAEDARYGFLQNRRGVVADFAVEYTLPRLVGFERAFELIVRAIRLTGREAVEWGLASRAVPADQVLETALEIATDMATNCSPLVMGLHKRLLWQSLDTSMSEAIDLESRALNYSMRKPDAIEGGMAYFEKRRPQWRTRLSVDWPDEF